MGVGGGIICIRNGAMREVLNMGNQNKMILDIDERTYGREGIEKMLERLNSNNDENNKPQNKQNREGIA